MTMWAYSVYNNQSSVLNSININANLVIDGILLTLFWFGKAEHRVLHQLLYVYVLQTSALKKQRCYCLAALSSGAVKRWLAASRSLYSCWLRCSRITAKKLNEFCDDVRLWEQNFLRCHFRVFLRLFRTRLVCCLISGSLLIFNSVVRLV